MQGSWQPSPRSTRLRSMRSTPARSRRRVSRQAMRRRGDARGTSERRPVRALSVGAEPRRRALAAAGRPDGLPILDPTPWAGGVEPFLIKSSSQFRAAPAAGARERRIGRASSTRSKPRPSYGLDSDGRSDVRRQVVAERAPPSWNEVARQLIARNHLDAADGARLLAMQNLSGADAAINCWNDKYHFDFWRPWNAIPGRWRTGTRRRPDATGWAALLTAPYPEWPSGHNCLDGRARRLPPYVLRRRARRGLPDHEPVGVPDPRRAYGADVRHLLAAARRAHRGPHLGWPPLPPRTWRVSGSAGASPPTGPRTTSSPCRASGRSRRT